MIKGPVIIYGGGGGGGGGTKEKRNVFVVMLCTVRVAWFVITVGILHR
jgi:hypothetical protein